MKLFTLSVLVLFLGACGPSQELKDFVASQQNGLPKDVDPNLTLKSVALNEKDKRVVFTYDMKGFNETQTAIMMNAVRDFGVNHFKARKDDIKLVYGNNYQIRTEYFYKGKKLKSISLSSQELE